MTKYMGFALFVISQQLAKSALSVLEIPVSWTVLIYTRLALKCQECRITSVRFVIVWLNFTNGVIV